MVAPVQIELFKPVEMLVNHTTPAKGLIDIHGIDQVEVWAEQWTKKHTVLALLPPNIAYELIDGHCSAFPSASATGNKTHREFSIDGQPTFVYDYKLEAYQRDGKCSHCGMGVVAFAIAKHRNQITGSFSVDALGVNAATGKLTLMTVDHIVPKSLYGNNSLANLRVMCAPCNTHRADLVTPDAALIEAGFDFMVNQQVRVHCGKQIRQLIDLRIEQERLAFSHGKEYLDRKGQAVDQAFCRAKRSFETRAGEQPNSPVRIARINDALQCFDKQLKKAWRLHEPTVVDAQRVTIAVAPLTEPVKTSKVFDWTKVRTFVAAMSSKFFSTSTHTH